MSAENNGGPAFPCDRRAVYGDSGWWGHGMTLRDYFAAHASEDDVMAQAEVIRQAQVKAYGMGVLPDVWRVTARYMHADAMLAEREKERT